MKQVIVFRSDLEIGKGKMAAHAGHAAIEGYDAVNKSNPEVISSWKKEGQKKVVLKIDGERELFRLYENVKKEVPSRVVSDAGLTQVAPGTVVCMVIGPWKDEIIDKYVKDLKLL